jgi:hypothetical protein
LIASFLFNETHGCGKRKEKKNKLENIRQKIVIATQLYDISERTRKNITSF